jgi:hypothetical protein
MGWCIEAANPVEDAIELEGDFTLIGFAAQTVQKLG